MRQTYPHLVSPNLARRGKTRRKGEALRNDTSHLVNCDFGVAHLAAHRSSGRDFGIFET